MLKTVLEYYGIIVLRCIINILNIFPIKSNRILFYSFNGKQYSCNPQIISEYILEHNGDKYEVIWAFKKPEEFCNKVDKRITLVKFRSIKYYYYAKTSKVVICNVQGYGEVSRRKNQYYIQTWHASNGYKKVGADKGLLRKLQMLGHKQYSYVLSGAQSMSERRIRGTMGFEGEIIKGTPRMDMLINQNAIGIEEKVYNYCSLDRKKKILLYAPTWRKNRNVIDYGLDYKQLKKALGKRFGGEWVIAIRFHPNVKMGTKIELPYVIDVTKYPDMQELLYTADAMISDYSSCIWDYSFENKPCFLFCTDLEENKIKFDLPIEKWHFSIAKNMNELENNINNYDEKKFTQAMKMHHDEMGSLEDGKATQRVCEIVEKLCTEKKMKKYKIGYTQGVYDMFHVGHLNLINNAKKYCDYLIVGVNSDKLVKQYKNILPVIKEEDRRIIVANIKAVDKVVVASTLDKVEQYKKYKFDAVFIGDDWKNNERWIKTEKELAKYNVDVVFLPHTDGICSTDLRKIKENI